ncbi:MAG: porin [Gammaproteobacteria bacterium]|nr:porin [Gammaproteobacteria bacterium]MBT8133727.1 porin [Gammaproteobacteria bacterium]NNJ48758.1 porin [Gammaproteobacteria bacterium]
MTTNTQKSISGRLTRTGLYSGILSALLAAPLTASAYTFKDSSGDVEFKVGGYAKLSAIYSGTDSGKLDNTLGRNIYLPSATPVGSGDSYQTLDLTARESRINFGAKTTQGGHKLSMFLEMDFLGTTDGNEVVSNSYSPRMRHFFFTFDNWLFGQTWSTFMDTAALAESVDFLPMPEGIVFIRQAQVRYTMGNVQVALENPESYITGTADRDVGILPDLTANMKLKVEGGHLRFNGLFRQLRVDEPGIDESEFGYGIGVSGKIKVGSTDDFRFSANYGDGMGRYTSLGLVKDGILINGKIETVKSIAASAAYRHVWNAKASSNIILSMADIDNPGGAAASENKGSTSIQINYLFRPVKQVSYGIMFLTGERETEGDGKGRLNRIQASAKYSF